MAEKIKNIYNERDRNYIIYTIGNSCKKQIIRGELSVFLCVGLFVKVNNVDDIFEWIIVFNKVDGFNNVGILRRIGV